MPKPAPVRMPASSNALEIVSGLGFTVPNSQLVVGAGFEATFKDTDFEMLLLKASKTVTAFMCDGWTPCAYDKDNLNYQMRKNGYYIALGVMRGKVSVYCEEAT